MLGTGFRQWVPSLAVGTAFAYQGGEAVAVPDLDLSQKVSLLQVESDGDRLRLRPAGDPVGLRKPVVFVRSGRLFLRMDGTAAVRESTLCEGIASLGKSSRGVSGGRE
jgi:hypothetical protein